MQKLLLPLFAALGFAATSSAQTSISEIRIDQDGPDNDEYFELVGTPGASLDDLTYLVIGDATGAGTGGGVEAVVSLAGMTLNASGYFLVGEGSMTIATPDLTANLNFENSDNVTHLLVQGFTGANGEDLDVDDDGALDSMPWTAVLDSVSLVETLGSGDWIYSANQLGPQASEVPMHVTKVAGSWYLNDAIIGYGDTPGSPNTHISTGDTFCDSAMVNSTGLSAKIAGYMGSGTGSGLHLQCTGGPAGEIGYFLVGQNVFDPGVAVSNGSLCLIGQVGDSFFRYNGFGSASNSIGRFDANGMLQNLVGTSGAAPGLESGFDVPSDIPDAIPMPIVAGDTWHFQAWYRDTPAGAGFSNFSNGLTVSF